jgi:hypothetical protein
MSTDDDTAVMPIYEHAVLELGDAYSERREPGGEWSRETHGGPGVEVQWAYRAARFVTDGDVEELQPFFADYDDRQSWARHLVSRLDDLGRQGWEVLQSAPDQVHHSNEMLLRRPVR